MSKPPPKDIKFYDNINPEEFFKEYNIDIPSQIKEYIKNYYNICDFSYDLCEKFKLEYITSIDKSNIVYGGSECDVNITELFSLTVEDIKYYIIFKFYKEGRDSECTLLEENDINLEENFKVYHEDNYKDEYFLKDIRDILDAVLYFKKMYKENSKERYLKFLEEKFE